MNPAAVKQHLALLLPKQGVVITFQDATSAFVGVGELITLHWRSMPMMSEADLETLIRVITEHAWGPTKNRTVTVRFDGQSDACFQEFAEQVGPHLETMQPQQPHLLLPFMEDDLLRRREMVAAFVSEKVLTPRLNQLALDRGMELIFGLDPSEGAPPRFFIRLDLKSDGVTVQTVFFDCWSGRYAVQGRWSGTVLTAPEEINTLMEAQITPYPKLPDSP